MIDVIIIGAGLVGSMTAKVLRDEGYSVRIFDSREKLSGSKCASGVWKEGWVNPKIKERVEEGLGTLQKYANIQLLDFYNRDNGKTEEMFYVDWSEICNEDYVDAKVFEVKNKKIEYIPTDSETDWTDEAKYAVLICAGAFTDKILSESGYAPIGIDAYWGNLLVLDGANMKMSVVKTWAPYKQIVALRYKDQGMKFSDGSTVKNPKPDDDRCDKVEARLLQHLEDTFPNLPDTLGVTYYTGLRPYLQDKSINFINTHDKNLFSATGGAKNTIILCGYFAQKLTEMVKNVG